MKTSVSFALLLMLALPAVHAETPEEKGLAISKETDIRGNGYTDSKYDAVLILKNAQGEESVREFSMKTFEVQGDGDKELGVFHKPADVKGTAVLTFSHGLKPDDQWLFLPELKRVKRISSVNKSGPFVGSEFAFEDIASWELKKYQYRYLRDETLDGIDCFVVENIPVYEYSGYSKLVEWVDKSNYQPVKMEYYDRKNALLKTSRLSEYKQYLGQFWRAHKIDMINHQNGKSTYLLRSNYQFKTGLKDSDFSESALKTVE